MLDALASSDRILAWQDRRYRFAFQLGQLLTDSGAPVSGHAVYGVYLADGVLLYVGQTRDAKRRLHDLPVGESHHLATTVPPETWDRVIVVQWPRLLDQVAATEAQAVERVGFDTSGLAIEHLLQLTFRPVMMTRRRSSTGEWNKRRVELSRSRGAVNSSTFPGLFDAVRTAWDYLVAVPRTSDRQLIARTEAGRVVFPRALM
jgi:hypothetical protein